MSHIHCISSPASPESLSPILLRGAEYQFVGGQSVVCRYFKVFTLAACFLSRRRWAILAFTRVAVFMRAHFRKPYNVAFDLAVGIVQILGSLGVEWPLVDKPAAQGNMIRLTTDAAALSVRDEGGRR